MDTIAAEIGPSGGGGVWFQDIRIACRKTSE